MKRTSLTLLLLSLIILEVKNSNIRQSYNEYELCKYSLSDGSKVDFTHLQTKGDDYTFSIGRYIYRANFCAPLKNQCPGSNTNAAVFIKNNICISKLTTNWQPSQLDYIDSHIPSKGVKLVFHSGDKCYVGGSTYELSYVLKCDPNKEVEFETIIKNQSCNYEYHFNTKYACPINFSSSSSGFSSKNILIYFVIIFSLYCVGFSYRNYRISPEDGVLKAFPHREFWSEFIDNTKTGIRVITRFIREKLNGGLNKDNYNDF